MRYVITSHETLSEALRRQGVELDLRCGGRGVCGRCRVQLLSGAWQTDRRPALDQEWVRACHTVLSGDRGEVEVPESSLAPGRGRVAAEWKSTIALPVSPLPVIAVDLGTTTVAAVKIVGGRVVGRASRFNRQSRYGDNVLTRICHAATDLQGVRSAALETIAEVVAELDSDGVSRIAVAGNTVMSLILHGIDPTAVGEAPFVPPVRRFPVCPAASLGLNCDAQVVTVPAISGFVGGDLVAGLGEVRLREGEMLVDLGTNCEMVFHSGRGWFCTSAAAGPAFEGSGISCGSRAVRGAIDHYRGPGEFSRIAGGTGDPPGVCGSALIDFLAVERREGRLNEFGRLVPSAPSREIGAGLRISEADIEALLKAKAAVSAGVMTLENYCGETCRRIYLAGGFASFVDLERAREIGMLPDRECEVVGNTSLGGAARLAVQPEYMAELERISDLPREVPLNEMPEFEMNYIDALLLP